MPDQTVHMHANAATRLSSILLSDSVDTACARLLEALQDMGLDGFCLGASSPEHTPGGRHYFPVVWRGRMTFRPVPGPLGQFLEAARGTGWLMIPLGQSETRNWVLAVNRDESVPARTDAIPMLELFGHALKAIVVPARVLPAAAEGGRPAVLSTIQLNYLRWAAEGKSSADIAVITGASRRAIEYHFTEILRKLSVSSRAQAVAWLAQSGAGRWSTTSTGMSRTAG